MKVRCERENLIKGIQTVARGVSSKNTIQILNGILITAKDNELIFNSTDLEIAIEYRDEMIIEEEGSIVIPGKYFSDIVRKLPNTEILLISENNTLKILYNNSEININGYDGEEFPLLPELDGSIKGNMDYDILKEIVKITSIAVSYDESRPVFTGILMQINDNKINFVATDTHRLALKESVWMIDSDLKEGSFIVPNRVLQEVTKVQADDNELVEIVISDKQIKFAIGNTIIVSRLIEGQYPMYKQVIPGANKVKTVSYVDNQILLETLDRASIMVKDQYKERSGNVRLSVEDNVMNINSNSPELGKIHEEILVHTEGENIDLSLNSRYLMDVLKVIDSDIIKIDFTGNVSPIIIRMKDDDSYLYLALPIKTMSWEGKQYVPWIFKVS